MSDPHKHHYVPAFYLRQWATNGFLCEMRKIRGKIVVHSKSPVGTGWLKDLYKIEGVGPDLAQHFERVFMQMVDTEAADAMRRFIGGNMDVPPLGRRVKRSVRPRRRLAKPRPRSRRRPRRSSTRACSTCSSSMTA